MKNRKFLFLIAIGAAVLLQACGGVESPGDKGILCYSILTNYTPKDTDLKKSTLVGAVTLSLSVDIIKYQSGIRWATISHSASPSTGVMITPDTTKCASLDPTAACVPNLIIKVTQPGAYKISSSASESVVDTITLNFDMADSIQPIVKVRPANEKNFTEISTAVQPVAVVQGSQIVFIPVPMKGTLRLVGNIKCDYTADPAWRAVIGRNVGVETEEESWYLDGQENYYLIEPGDLSFTFTNAEMQTSTTVKFAVSQIPH